MMELRFELKTFSFNTMLNHYLFQKFKLIGIGKFNYLINTLTISIDPFGLTFQKHFEYYLFYH
jgi:hypothetical protein